jgi:hypothetical protein
MAATMASATTMSMPGIVFRRLTPSSERASSRTEVVGEPIELAQIPLDSEPLVGRQHLSEKLDAAAR